MPPPFTATGASVNFFSRTARMRTRHCRTPGKRRCTQRCPTRRAQRLVVKVLLAHGANPNRASKPGAETGAFMRDCRTRGETPLHRAAAFADEATIQLLLDAGAKIDAKDVNGDAPLTWGSWHQRPDSILRKLCYGPFFVRPERLPMDEYLAGQPHK